MVEDHVPGSDSSESFGWVNKSCSWGGVFRVCEGLLA
jgi:hypothetical protein